VVQRREEAGNPIDVKLKQVADELHSVIVGYLQVGNTCNCCAYGICRCKFKVNVKKEKLSLCISGLIKNHAMKTCYSVQISQPYKSDGVAKVLYIR
jgi:hypothetical protein